MTKAYINLKKTNDKNGEISFEAEIPLESLETKMNEALIRESADFSLPGFRKGKVPEHIVRQHISEMALLEDAAHNGLENAVREIMADEKLSIIGAPQATITKIAPKNPVTFTVKFALYPSFELPDYRKIGKVIADRKEQSEASESDIDEAIARIQKMMAGEHEHAEGEECTHDEKEKTKLPEITDEFVKQFGPFNTVADFRAEVGRQLVQEKEMQIKEVKREEIVKKIMESSKIKLPQLLVDEEYYNFIGRRDEELEKAEMSLEAYLKEIKKTEKEFEHDERKLIEDRIKISLVLGEIRKKEDVKADENEIRKFIPSLKMRYPNRTEADLHRTTEAYIIQEKLFDIFEGKEEIKTPEKIEGVASEEE